MLGLSIAADSVGCIRTHPKLYFIYYSHAYVRSKIATVNKLQGCSCRLLPTSYMHQTLVYSYSCQLSQIETSIKHQPIMLFILPVMLCCSTQTVYLLCSQLCSNFLPQISCLTNSFALSVYG